MNAWLFRIAALVALAAPTGAEAALNAYYQPNFRFADGSDGFAFTTSGGIENPGVIVGFNPQPDPPATPLTVLDLRDPTRPLFDQSSGKSFILTVSLFPGRASLLLPAVQEPNADGRTQLGFCDGSVRGACDGSVFFVSLAFSGPGGIVDWVAFNPQPDPPGDFFSYQVTFRGDATVALDITENGAPLTFSAAPEPGTWLLMGLGFAAMGAVAWQTRARAA